MDTLENMSLAELCSIPDTLRNKWHHSKLSLYHQLVHDNHEKEFKHVRHLTSKFENDDKTLKEFIQDFRNAILS